MDENGRAVWVIGEARVVDHPERGNRLPRMAAIVAEQGHRDGAAVCGREVCQIEAYLVERAGAGIAEREPRETAMLNRGIRSAYGLPGRIVVSRQRALHRLIDGRDVRPSRIRMYVTVV